MGLIRIIRWNRYIGFKRFNGFKFLIKMGLIGMSARIKGCAPILSH